MAPLRHGLARRNKMHPIYALWEKVKQRCYGAYDKAFFRYGGRGIAMCDEWLHDCRTFVNWATANGYKKGLQIDRIDNNGPYAPWNCRFVTRRQNCNNRRSTKYVTYNGEQLPFQYAIEKSGTTVKQGTIWRRLKIGMTFEDAIVDVNYNTKNLRRLSHA